MPHTTANATATRSGTGWTIDVTSCNLSSNLAIKDFRPIHNSIVVSVDDYTKTSQTTLTYTGAAVPASTNVEIRRNTSDGQIKDIEYASRFSSQDMDNELDRVHRIFAEARLNGLGGSAGLTVSVLDVPYAASWDGDVINAPSRNVVYDKFTGVDADIALRGLKGGDVYTGDHDFSGGILRASTLAQDTNTNRVATTAFVLGQISDAAYGGGWNGVTTQTASKNAIYDKLSSMVIDAAYGPSWNGITSSAPSRNALYDELELKAYKGGETYTGAHDFTGSTVDVTTQTAGNNTTRPASTAFVTTAVSNKPNYSESTVTPVLTLSTPGDLIVGYNSRVWKQTNIGNSAYIYLHILLNSFSNSTGTGSILITGLPQNSSGRDIIVPCVLTPAGGLANQGPASLLWASGSTQMTIRHQNTSTGVQVALAQGQLHTGFAVHGVIVYTTF